MRSLICVEVYIILKGLDINNRVFKFLYFIVFLICVLNRFGLEFNFNTGEKWLNFTCLLIKEPRYVNDVDPINSQKIMYIKIKWNISNILLN